MEVKMEKTSGKLKTHGEPVGEKTDISEWLDLIKKLDKNIDIRKKNFKYWYDSVSQNNTKFILPEYQKGNSSFCFPIITKDREEISKIKQRLKENEIESRPIISGNILRHPAFSEYKLCTNKSSSNADVLHYNGVYVGNSQFVTKKRIDKLVSIMFDWLWLVIIDWATMVALAIKCFSMHHLEILLQITIMIGVYLQRV